MKKYLYLAALFIGTLVLYSAVTYPKAGKTIFDTAMYLESRFYGFEKAQAPIENMTLHYYHNAKPEKPTLVLLHGYSADKTVWLRFANQLDDYNIVIPDLAGHGESGFTKGADYSIAAQAKRIAALINHLQLEKVHLAGNSMGGFISAYMARFYPEFLLSAIMIDPAGLKQSPTPSTMDILRAKGRNPFHMQQDDQFETFYHMTMAKPPFVPQIVLDYKAEQYVAKRAQLEEIFSDFFGNDLLDDELKHIKVPSLLLWGEQDQLIHVSAATVWQQKMSNLEVVTWPDLGHMPMVEAPARTAEAVDQFIKAI